MRRYGGRAKSQEVLGRLEFELQTIEKMGFADYFLIVWDFVKYAKDRKIAVGPGRGSAAGSIVAYALEITDLDPLEYSLLFERFLNPDRINMPDVDIDFSVSGRSEVMRYVTDKYGGHEHVAQIITFGTIGAKAAIRDSGQDLPVPLLGHGQARQVHPRQAGRDHAPRRAAPRERLVRRRGETPWSCAGDHRSSWSRTRLRSRSSTPPSR